MEDLGVASNNHIKLEPGTLLRNAEDTSRRALAGGALLPVDTRTTFLEDGGMRFVVRIVSSLARKHQALAALDESRPTDETADNPFLPHDEALFVADVSGTHFCLLNKYNVIENHLLLVTREFEHQEELLTDDDFTATLACMAEFDCLVFYNGGREGGASQPHRHVQVVPLPLVPGESGLPVDPLVEKACRDRTPAAIPEFPFAHVALPMDRQALEDPERGAVMLRAKYGEMLQAVGMQFDLAPGARQCRPDNLLMTRRWMLLVPRSSESYRRVPVNCLGFAGSLLARNEEDLEVLRDLGPMNVLRAVATPR